MKKLIVLFCILLTITVRANILVPSLKIYEVFFDESDDWALEFVVDFYDYEFQFYGIDSIKIETSSGIATVLGFDTTHFCVITNQNLSIPLSINKDNDLIVLHAYIYGYWETDSIAIGEYQNSYLKNIEYGHSIAKNCLDKPFYKTSCPTIGDENNLNCTKGVAQGYFYNNDGEVLNNKHFFINDGYSGKIIIDISGFFSANLTSRSYDISSLILYETDDDYALTYIQPVSFEIFENDTVSINFISTSIPEIKSEKHFISIYPNPAKDHAIFIINSNIINSSRLNLTIFNILGYRIDRIAVETNEVYYNCSNLTNGTYISVLSVGNKTITSKKFHVLK